MTFDFLAHLNPINFVNIERLYNRSSFDFNLHTLRIYGNLQGVITYIILLAFVKTLYKISKKLIYLDFEWIS